ncbi:MAG: glycosyltransferase family 2 protein [Planctomycetota bacterium]|jgi:dolichol-phosphate mannosyltransferase
MKESDTRQPRVNNKKRVVLIVPVHNEEGNLEVFFQRAMATAATIADRAVLNVLFVDDASTDRSPEILADLAGRDHRVIVASLVRNFGSHAAIKCGLELEEADYYAALSADLQDPPELIEQLFNKAEETGVDVVWGVRTSRQDPLSKRMMAAAFYSLIRRIGLPSLPKKGVDTYMISTKVRDEFLRIPEKNTMPYYLLMWLGFPQAFVPYDRQPRHSGSTKWTFRRRLKNAVDSILGFSSAPIQAITYLGLAAALAAATLIVWLVINKIIGHPSPGWTATAVIIAVATAIQSFMLAVLAQYVWRISEAVRGRPDFVLGKVTRSGKAVEIPSPAPRTTADDTESSDEKLEAR